MKILYSNLIYFLYIFVKYIKQLNTLVEVAAFSVEITFIDRVFLSQLTPSTKTRWF